MKFSRIFACSVLSVSLTACSTFSGLFGGDKAPAPEVAKKTPAAVVKKTSTDKKAAQQFELFVGSTMQGSAKVTVSKKGKKTTQKTVQQDVPVKVGNTTYYTAGAIVKNADVKTAFVAKTLSGEPALGLRLLPAANARLSAALKVNHAGAVLASLNNVVFTKVNSAGAQLMDGVLLLPMASLNEARDVAEVLRRK